jgi:hypothetical protein
VIKTKKEIVIPQLMTIKAAHKRRDCFHCGQDIEKGSIYKRYMRRLLRRGHLGKVYP